jgi:N-methylhydantoinase A
VSSCRIGIDVGGTFTDVVLVDEASGLRHRVKVPSTPPDPSRGAVDGVAEVLRQAGFDSREVSYFAHGTTVATNAILEGKLASTALVTTAGFRDVLEIGRQRRPNAYDFHAQKPPILVPRSRRFEVRERIGSRGEVVLPLVEADVHALVDRLRAPDVQSVAICLLFSFLNPDHEQRVAAILRAALPELPIFVSSEILPEYREYERTSTVVLSAAVAPVVSRYVGSLRQTLRAAGVACQLHLMKSTGGLMSFDTVERRAAETVLSGPAAGAIASGYWGALTEQRQVIGFDMGGTSADVSLVVDGRPRVTSEGKIADYPLKLPMLDVRTIGTGGGSIAWLDVADILHVGPQSAGADPGPACYGRQAQYPTVTDANVCLGRLDPAHFLGGAMTLDRAAAESVVLERIGRPLGRDLVRAAQAIVDIADSNMARAIREISVANGHDVREFALMSFGGAAGLHACSLAEELDVPLVVVPEDAGLLSASGLLVADVESEYSLTRASAADATSAADVRAGFALLEERARRELRADGVDADQCVYRRQLDLRYAGQAYEIAVPEPPAASEAALVAEWVAGFHRQHRQLYWWDDPDRPVEIVTYRLHAVLPVPRIAPCAEPPGAADPAAARRGTRPIYFAGQAGPTETPVFERAALRAGHVLAGPAVVESFDTTVLVAPAFRAAVDPYRNLLLQRQSGGRDG